MSPPPSDPLRDGAGGTPELLLLCTVDTEGSLERMRRPDPARVADLLIFGGPERFGIDLHMDLFESVGATGCFFVDVLMEFRFGEECVARVVERIRERGHEIQLHAHADHLRYADDEQLRALAPALGRDDPHLFRELIQVCLDRFEHHVGQPAIAYRAGGYRISDVHFEVLADAGLRIDSSVQTWFHARVSDQLRGRTQPYRVGSLLEVPPSWYIRRQASGVGVPRSYAPAPGAGPEGCMTALPRIGAAPTVITMVSHSFALLRSARVSDPGFRAEWIAALTETTGGELHDRALPPEDYRFTVSDAERDEQLVAYLAGELRAVSERPTARCVTYAELDRLAREGRWWTDAHARGIDPVPCVDERGAARVRWIRVPSRGAAVSRTERTSLLGSSRPPSHVISWRGLSADRLDAARAELSDFFSGRPVGETATVIVDVLPGMAELDGADAGRDAARRAELTLDAESFARIFEEIGLDVVWLERLFRPAAEVAAIRRAGPRFDGLDPIELRTAQASFRLRRTEEQRASLPVAPRRANDELRQLTEQCAPARTAVTVGGATEVMDELLESGRVERVTAPQEAPPGEVGLLLVGEVFEHTSPAALASVTHDAYGLLHPGGEAIVAVGPHGGLTPTTVLAALLRAGFATVRTVEGSTLCALLARPFEVEDIDREAGGRVLR